MRLQALFPALILVGVVSCETAPTAPPPILATPGMFEFTVSGSIEAALTGPAIYEDGVTGLQVTMSAIAPAHQIVIGPGVFSSGEFAWPVGSHSMAQSFPSSEIELRYTAAGNTYFSISGKLTIMESTPTHVIAAVDVRAASPSHSIRIRGSFHALVEPP